MFRIWNMLSLIEETKDKFQASSGREADIMAVSDATITLAGMAGCNHVSGLDIEIRDDLPLGEIYLFNKDVGEGKERTL